jgi:class 3 adenylate cyclase
MPARSALTEPLRPPESLRSPESLRPSEPVHASGAGRDPAAVRIRPWTLRFSEPWLEERYQDVAGKQSIGGFQMACLFGVALWGIGAALLALTTNVDPVVAATIGVLLAALNLGAFLAAPWTTTLDRQHGIATPLAVANGTGVLVLAAAAGALDAYAASALVLVQVFWFVASTRFVFAVIRSVGILAAFAVVTALHPARGTLLLHGFILVAATAAILLALYRLERARRQVFQSDLVVAAQAAELEAQKAQSDGLLLNMLPAGVASRLIAEPGLLAEEFPATTVLFADLVGFTPFAARLPASEVVLHLNEIFSRFDDLADRYGVEKVKTVGDAYMVVGGLPLPQADHADRIVALGLAMIEETARYAKQSGIPLSLRVGVHSGPVVAGVIGKHKLSYDLWGDTVNIASRMESHGLPDTVQMSDSTWRLLRDDVAGTCRGEIELKGRGTMPTWIARPEPARPRGAGLESPRIGHPRRPAAVEPVPAGAT